MIIKKIIQITIAGLIPLLLLTSCGNDSTAPSDGSINLAPTDYTLTTAAIAACPDVYPPASFITSDFTISVVDRNGNPLGNVDIEINASFSSNSSNFYRRLWLFDDEAGNNDGDIRDPTGTLLDDAELVSGIGNPTTYRTKTNSAGTKKIYIAVHADGSCGFTGQITVSSGVLSNSFDIAYTAS